MTAGGHLDVSVPCLNLRVNFGSLWAIARNELCDLIKIIAR